ncbi:aspartyl protease family protein 1-like isoform X1 [Papaver somniferum]|uniref:aspartyl protease family protein 1-like isoform X1 n=1 Tax=Papaver somniferum TaxID=3469 RepID=UPI000E7006A9|nr:aspartyl protease family protein 1-like isoform X1 [Papaver somniferum]
MASSCSFSRKYLITLLLVLSMYIQELRNCNAFQTFGFEMHHRYSDQVKSIMGGDNLPEKGSLKYYVAMVQRDKVFRGRALAGNDAEDLKRLTFSNGNETLLIPSLGSLQYANVSLGTPSLSFLVALDTGSDLFWVPCDCTSCVRSFMTSYGDVINLNIYSSNSSSTSKYVSCNGRQCPYQVLYKDNSSTSGVLVEDVLHLATDNHNPKPVDAKIIFGCGQVQKGSPTGLLGLGMGNISVPSILSIEGQIADSFSMCFGSDGVGRISFGDKGSLDQEETPFILRQRQQIYYEVSVNQLSVGKNLSDLLGFSAIFDSGTSFTHLNDPAYTAICESFDSQAQAQQKRHSSDPGIPFEYCYDVSSNSTEFSVDVSLIMKGGSQFNVYDPLVRIIEGTTIIAYCLAVVRSPDVNIIGHSFMTGHHIVFDREKMVLGWKESNCYEIVDPSTQPRFPQIPKESPPTINVQPRFVYGGPPRNGVNSRAPQLLVGKLQSLCLVASSLFVISLILQIV